jgi:RNA polymerase-associated protein
MVRLVLAAKALPHDRVTVDNHRIRDELLQYNPLGTLPTLVERDVVLYTPAVIAEYLDERFPHPPLLPSDPLGRARTRLTVHRVGEEWGGPLQAVLDGQADGAGRDALRKALLASNDLFRVAKYFLSPEFSLADCALLPILWRLPAAEIDLPGADALGKYCERLFGTPFFDRSLTETERRMRPTETA